MSKNLLWRHGSSWLIHPTDVSHSYEEDSELCRAELKIKEGGVTHTPLNPDEIVNLNCVIDCKCYRKLSALLRVMAYVIKFVRILKCKIKKVETSIFAELSAADVAEVNLFG